MVDALRACRYRDAFSLADMAAISRMPVETFRKRFTAELGIPPLGYLQFLKMERAKTLLRDGMSVRQTGVEIGMPDPYHFSKQFQAHRRHEPHGLPQACGHRGAPHAGGKFRNVIPYSVLPLAPAKSCAILLLGRSLSPARAEIKE